MVSPQDPLYPPGFATFAPGDQGVDTPPPPAVRNAVLLVPLKLAVALAGRMTHGHAEKLRAKGATVAPDGGLMAHARMEQPLAYVPPDVKV